MGMIMLAASLAIIIYLVVQLYGVHVLSESLKTEVTDVPEVEEQIPHEQPADTGDDIIIEIPSQESGEQPTAPPDITVTF